MPPQLEANKKQHLQHWEESMHQIFKQQLFYHTSFWLSYTWLLKKAQKTDHDAINKKKKS